VHSDIPAGAEFGGYPAVPIREFRRHVAALSRLGKGKGA
jgi:hypothetical protein